MNSDPVEPSLVSSESKEDDQVMYDIDKPHHNDVLCGRGVSTNRHSGNESFRRLVGLNKVRAPFKHSGFLSPPSFLCGIPVILALFTYENNTYLKVQGMLYLRYYANSKENLSEQSRTRSHLFLHMMPLWDQKDRIRPWLFSKYL